MSAKDRVVWLERAWMPVYFGFCPSEAAWKREVKRLGCPTEVYPPSIGKHATCTTLQNAEGELTCIVSVNEKFDKKPWFTIAPVITHECVHIWQKIRHEIGETDPSPEFEAYTIQHLSQQVMTAYARTRQGRPRQRKTR